MSNAEKERIEAIKNLKELLKPTDTVYTILRHVSNSGMMRVISTIIIKDNSPRDITYLVAEALGYKLHPQHYGLKVGGCGMDMGFHVVYNLSATLFNEDAKQYRERHEALKNPNVSSDYRDKSAGYWLNQKWL